MPIFSRSLLGWWLVWLVARNLGRRRRVIAVNINNITRTPTRGHTPAHCSNSVESIVLAWYKILSYFCLRLDFAVTLMRDICKVAALCPPCPCLAPQPRLRVHCTTHSWGLTHASCWSREQPGVSRPGGNSQAMYFCKKQ